MGGFFSSNILFISIIILYYGAYKIGVFDDAIKVIKESLSNKPSSGTSGSNSSGSTSSKPSSETSGAGSSSGGTSSKPSSGTSGSGSSSSSNSDSSGSSSTAEKEKVWIVDIPARYEKEPIYGEGYEGYWIKDADGNVIYKTTDVNEFQAKKEEFWDSENFNWTWGQNLPAEIIGYRDVCVQGEQRHWEYR